MTKFEEYLRERYPKSSLGRIVAETRPGRADIYLDGEAVLDSSGQIAKTPTVIHNVTEGTHTVTFSRAGYSDITVIANVSNGSDCHARALLNTSMFSYPMMMSEQPSQPLQQLQPSPGWPYLPIEQVTYGHMITNTTPDGAKIYIDDQPVLDINGNVATTPSSITGIITGVHKVTFKKAGYRDEDIMVDIQNGLYSDVRTTLLSLVT